jgi:hypothetical protein
MIITRSDSDNSLVLLRHRNLTLHWASNNGWFATRGYEIWHSANQGVSWTKVNLLKSGLKNWCAKHPFMSQACRFGINNLICLSSGTIICVADGVVYRSEDQATSFSSVFSEFQGRGPLRQGICQDHIGRIYIGEYWRNKKRKSVRILRSDDDGVTWNPVHSWPSKTTGHVHFVQFDPIEKMIWVGTGDDDSECRIAYSRDGGETFHLIGGGSQIWRAVSVMITPKAIFWGTDIGIDHEGQRNYLIRWDRSTQKLEKILTIDGPAYYSTQTIQGTMVVGKAVEGGKNEKDQCVHLYWTKDHINWQDMCLWPKYPAPGIFGPATISFPSSDALQSRLLFNVRFIRSRYNGSLFELLF